ncbi:putative uncharacterized protein DDB_G0287113 [Archocentrus centrarchus]|uniref:putative uncharacterized protein DDB_G0287113 n=1 Tax=Archocentrus centrarchus TaxID=63155 RepID=UPI0011E9D526|nr:putative uncharacterized protein DDB_G0287113 [Archocentrus centrarchus]
MRALKTENKRLLERIGDLQRSLGVCKRVAAGLRKGPSVLAQPVLHPVRRRKRRRAEASAAAQQEEEEEKEQQQQQLKEQQQQQLEEEEEQQKEKQESSHGEVDPEQHVEGPEAAEVIEIARVETVEVGETEEREQSGSAAAESKTPDASGEGKLCTWSAGSGKGNQMHLLKLPESMSTYLDRFQSFHLHEFGTQKMKEGASSRVSRVKSFLHYMSLGKIRLSDWQFLYDVEKIKA